MNRLDRYLGRAVAAATLYAWAALGGLMVLFALLAELTDLGRDGYGLAALLRYVALTAPRRVYEVLPAAALIGGLTGLGALVQGGELTAMRAAGASLARLARAVLLAALPLLLAGLVVGEGFAPGMEEAAQRGRALAQGRQALAGTGGGFWNRRGEVYLNVARVEAGGVIGGIEAWEFRDGALKRVVRAPRGRHGAGGWVLEDASLTEFTPQGRRTGRVERLAAPFLPEPGAMAISRAEPERLSLPRLVQQGQLLERNGRNADRYWLALWKKLTAPLTTAALLLLTLPLVLSTGRTVALGQRLFVGVVVGLVYYLLDQAFAWGGLAYGLPLAAAATLPTAAAAALAVAGLWRTARV